jgi:hypothetical protein
MGGGRFKSTTPREQVPKLEYYLVRNFGPQAERISQLRTAGGKNSATIRFNALNG